MAYSGQAVFGGTTDPVTGSWSNATALNSTIVSSDITGYGVVAASFVISGSITQGTAIFEVSDDAGTTWWPISGLQTGNNNQATTFNLAGGLNASYEFATGAYNLFRVRLNPVILGSGTVAIRLSAEAFPFLTAVAITGTTNVSITGTNTVTVSGTVAVTQSGTWNVTVNTPLPAGTNVIGHVITDSGSTTAVTGTVAVTQSTSPWVVSLTSTTITGTVAVTQSTSPWTIQGDSASGAANAGNPVKVGGVFNTTQPTVTNGQTVDAQTTARGAQIVAVGVDGFAVTVGGTVAVTQSTSPWVVSLTSTTITGTVAVTQSTSPWVVAGAAASGAAKSGNPVQIGGVFNTTQPTVTTGQAVEVQATARGAQIVATGVDTFNVTVNAALPAGTNVIGHVITDSGSTTAVTGTVAVTQSTSPWVVSLTSTTITGTVAVTQSTSPWVTSGNLTHNNAAPAANNVGVLPAVASTSAPTYTTGDQVLLSTDLTGNLRVVGSFSAGALPDLVGTTTALNALNTAATINAFGYNSVGFFLASGTLAATIVPEVSYDGGTTWVATFFDDPTTSNKVASLTFTNPNAATSRSIVGCGGASNVRVRVSAFTSGTASGTLRANDIADPSSLFGGAAGAALAPTVAQVGGSVTTNAPAYSTGTMNALSLDTSGLLRVSLKDSPSNTNNINVNIAASAATVTVSGTVTANQGTSPWVVNMTQVAGTTLGTPQTFGTAPSGVVVGTSSDIYVAGTRARSNQTTTAAGVLDVNIVGSLGATNSVTNGTFIAITDNTTKVGVISGTTALKTDQSSQAGTAITTVPVAFGTGTPSGNAPGVNAALFVGTTPVRSNQTTTATGAVDNNLVGVKGTTVVTAAAGVQQVGIVGNAAATLDSTVGAGTAPTNALATSGIYSTTLPAPTNSQAVAVQIDQSGNKLTFPGVQFKTGAAWSSATAINTLQFATGTTTQGALTGAGSILVQLDQTTTLTGGAVTFQGTYDNINWVTIPVAQVVNPNTYTPLSNPYTFVASTNQPFLLVVQGYASIRANLTTVITGTGTVTPYWATLQSAPAGAAPVAATNSGTSNTASAAWTSATANNTAVALNSAIFSYGTLVVTLNQAPSGTLTAGGVLFEVSNDNANWVAIAGAQQGGGNAVSTFAFTVATYSAFVFDIAGWQYFRVRLNPVITGTGTVTVGFAAQSQSIPFNYVKDVRDTGRTYITFTILNVTGVTAEALTTFTVNKAAATSSGTSYTVTTGKTFRIQSMTFTSTSSSGSHNASVRLRAVASGSVSATSPVLIAGYVAASTSASTAFEQSIPDGLELPGGSQLGISNLCDSTNSSIYATVVGYEY